MFKEKRMVYREVPGGGEPENSKPQDSKEKAFNTRKELENLSEKVVSEATEPKVVKIDEAQQLANMFGVFGNGEESLMGEMDFILDGKLIQVEELCKQKANYADIMNFIKSKSADEMRVENALLAMSQSDPNVKYIYNKWMKEAESLYKNLLADARYEEASSFSLVDVKDEDVQKAKDAKDAQTQAELLTNTLEIKEYKRSKAFEIMRELGISQRKIDEVFNDWTNPYIYWAMDVLGGLDKNQIKREKQSKKTSGVFYSTNLNRLLNWGEKVYPKLLKITGGDDGYADYDFAIREAVLKGAPRMKEFLDWCFDKNVTNPGGYPHMNRLVKDELDGIRSDATVKQLIKEDEDRMEARRQKLEGLPDNVSDDVELPIEVTKRKMRELLATQKEPFDTGKISTETYDESSYQPSYGKYAGTMDSLTDLVKETEYAESLSDEEYGILNEGLDDLISDVTEQNSDLKSFADQANEVISIVEGMAASGEYTYSEIRAYIDSTGISSQFEELSKSGADKDALHAIMALFEYKLQVIYDHYGVEQSVEIITKEE